MSDINTMRDAYEHWTAVGASDEKQAEARRKFDAILAAHDAAKRAEWEAEVAERVEWGCLFPDGAIVKCEDQKDAETERTYVLDMFPEAVVVRRNVRGPGDWLPVTNTESEGKA